MKEDQRCYVASITAMILFHIIIHPAVPIYDFHIIFITSLLSFHVFITHQLNDLLPVGLLVQLVARCTGIAEVKGLNPVYKPEFISVFPSLKTS